LLYGSWAIVAVVLWHWFKTLGIEPDPAADEPYFRGGKLISSIAYATIPMFVIGRIMAVVITSRAPWGEDADEAGAAFGADGCVFVFGIPARLILLIQNVLDFLLIPIYGFGAAWLINKLFEPNPQIGPAADLAVLSTASKHWARHTEILRGQVPLRCFQSVHVAGPFCVAVDALRSSTRDQSTFDCHDGCL
jgi:hypothetical protein